MRYTICWLVLFASSLHGQDVRDVFFLTDQMLRTYVCPDGQLIRTQQDIVTPDEWPETKRLAYVQYPLAEAMAESAVPKTAATVFNLLKAQTKPISIGYCWVKDPIRLTGPPLMARIIFWLEPRPKHLNDDELTLAVKKGEFEHLFPPYPIGKFTGIEGFRLSSRYVDFPIPSVSTTMSLGGIYVDPRPIECGVDLYSDWLIQSEELINREIESYLNAIGNGWGNEKSLGVIQTASGIVLKNGGTQFGHIGYRWVSKGNVFSLNILGQAPGVLEAFVRQQPSELPRDLVINKDNAGMLILRHGLARLRSAPSVLTDDERMIRIHPMQNHNQFGKGIDLLISLKDLWPVVYGYRKERVARYDQHLSPESAVFSWQAYIDEETAARAKVLAAVERFAVQAEQRGLKYQEKVSRLPWGQWAEDRLPPCYVLGPEK